MTRWVDEFFFDQKDRLGAGQFGTVYKGTNNKTNEIVAIKVISKDSLDDYLYQQLQNEVNALSSLHSPSIVKFLTFRVTEHNVYIITEFCDGGDLDHVIKKRGKLPEKEVVGYLKELCDALVEMKRHNVMHRDLKPANILIKGGKLKIADLGLAKVAENFEKAMKRSVVGSPLYMAPQLLSREPYSYKCDIWSIGIMIYQFLYGNAPWMAMDMGGLTKQILSKPLQFPKEPPVSPEMMELIRGCLQLHERDRITLEELCKSPVFNPSPKRLFDMPQHLPPQIQLLPVMPPEPPQQPKSAPPAQAPYPIARVPGEKSPGGPGVFMPGFGGSPAIHGEPTPTNRTPTHLGIRDPHQHRHPPSASPGGRATPTYGGHPNTYRGRPDLSPNAAMGGQHPGFAPQRPRTPVGHNSPGTGGWPAPPTYQPMRYNH